MAESDNGDSVNSGSNFPGNNGQALIDLGSLIEEINENSEGLSEEQRNGLQQRLQEVIAFCRSNRFNNAISSNEGNTDDTSSVDKTIRTVMRFIAEVLQKGGKLAPEPAHMILTGVGEVINYFSREDLVSEVTKKFRSVLDEDFLRRFEASCNRFFSCAWYIKGMPNPRNLQSDQKRSYLSRMAADMPVNTGIEEIEELHSDIKKAIKATNLSDMTSLMSKVELYCCFTTFRELFLLARVLVELEYETDTQSTRNVLEVQQYRDQVLLCFLYRPNLTTVDAFLKYDSNRWPVVREFLERRQFFRNMESLDNKLFRIRSVYYPDNLLSHHDYLFLTFLRCHAGTEGEHTIFRLRKVENDVYTIRPYTRPDHYVYNRFWVRINTDPKRQSSEWRIIRIEPDTTEGPVLYLLVLNSSKKKCVYVDNTGRVYAWRKRKGDRKCLWYLQEIENESAV